MCEERGLTLVEIGEGVGVELPLGPRFRSTTEDNPPILLLLNTVCSAGFC